jgi:hypothetical protein
MTKSFLAACPKRQAASADDSSQPGPSGTLLKKTVALFKSKSDKDFRL